MTNHPHRSRSPALVWRYAEVDIVRRCARCGEWGGLQTIAHGGLGTPMCHFAPTGQCRVTVWLRAAHTIRRTGEVVPHPWEARRATAEERKILAPLIHEVRQAGRPIRDRDIGHILLPAPRGSLPPAGN